MLKRSTLQLLRLHFSFFLLPVFLFAISDLPEVDWQNAIVVFIILHLLVYPASNGYNSYMDRDETPIGGLKNPLQPTKELFFTTVLMDVLAVVNSLFIGIAFSVGILFYILASRAYSYRGIRLKKFPVIGFLIVFIFQGAVIFFISYYACGSQNLQQVPLLPCVISSLLIGASYPLTQIYQHKEDKEDGVTTISYVLGKKGSFLFSGFLFITATLLMYQYFTQIQNLRFFYIFLICTAPMVLFFLYWMMKVWQDGQQANFKNSFLMNILSTVCTTSFFIIFLISNHFE